MQNAKGIFRVFMALLLLAPPIAGAGASGAPFSPTIGTQAPAHIFPADRASMTGSASATLSARLVTARDIPALMARYGVYEPGRNYNVIIDGHGTGDAPPSLDEYGSFVGNMMVCEPMTPEPLADLSPSVDWSSSPFFPPVGNQASQGSCAAWNIGYYVNGYLQRKDNNWTNSTNLTQQMSPSWVYNKNNYGVDGGSAREYHIELIATIGNADMATMPYNQSDYRSWGGEEAWRSAPRHRIESEYDTTGPWNTNLIKYWLAQGDVLSISFDANVLFGGIGSDMVVSSKEYNHAGSNHAVTIVGYDDFKTADNDAGAFKIANSWGKGWGSSGYFWMTYDALAEIPDRDILRLHDRVDYAPSLLATVNQTVPGSRDALIEIGTGSGKYSAFRPFWNGHQRISGTIPGFPGFMAFDISDLDEDLGLADYWLQLGAGRSANANISSFGIELYPAGYGLNLSMRSANSADTPMLAPCKLNIPALEDVHTSISSPPNGSWQRAVVPLSGNSSGRIDRTVFSEDFESWSPADNWNVKDLYKTGREYNGWAVTGERYSQGERSLWSAGSDDGRSYIEDFEQGWPPSGWATSSDGPDRYPFVRTNTLFRGCGPHDCLAVANSTRGAGTNITERLYMTAPVNASCHQNLSLEFYLDYDLNSTDEYAEVQYATWSTYPAFTRLQRYTADAWGYKRLDLSFLDGNDAIYIGFVYHGTDDHYMAVDDVVIAGNKTKYDQDMNAYTEKVFGNISGLDGAELEYRYWVDAEQGADQLQAYYRASTPSGPMVVLENSTGRIQSWNASVLDIPKNATVAGFLFKSNSSISYEGAYVDGMRLTGYTVLDDLMIKVDNGTWTFVNTSANWSYGWDSTGFADGEHIVRIRANYSGAYASSHFHLNIDNTAPNITGWSNGPMTTGDRTRMSVNASDPRGIGKVELRYSVNGGPEEAVPVPEAGNGTWALDLTVPRDAVSLTYRFWVEDGIGNGIHSPGVEVRVRDNDPPALGEDLTPSIATTGDPLLFSLHPTDNIAVSNSSVEFWYGNGSHANITESGSAFDKTITVRDTLESLHYFFSAMDTSGNRAAGDVRDVLITDNDPPALVDRTLPNATTNDSFAFSCEATDNLNVSSVEVEYWYGRGAHAAGRLAGNASYRLETRIPDTLYNLTYILTAADSSGNARRTSPRNITIIDNDPPVLVNDSSPDIALTGGDYLFDVTVKDNIGIANAEVEYRFGSAGSKGFISDIGSLRIGVPEDSLEDLVYVIRITDTSGNLFTSGERRVRVLDAIPPVIGKDLSDDSPSTGDPFDFSVEIRDNIGVRAAAVRYWHDDGAPTELSLSGNGPFTARVTIPSDFPGRMHYLFIAADASGNENSTDENTLDVRDNDPPVFTYDLTPRETSPGPVEFKVEVKDNIAVSSVTAFFWSEAGQERSIALSAEGGKWAGRASLASAGIAYYRFMATDPSGNIAEPPVSSIRIGQWNSIRPDINSPAVVITGPPMRTEFPAGTGEVDVRWRASDDESGLEGCEVQLDSGPGASTGLDMHHLFTGLDRGVHIVTARAFDRAGNAGTAVVVFSIGDGFSDRTPPDVKITGPKEGQTLTDGEFTAVWTGFDGESGILGYYLKVDDQPFVYVGPSTLAVLNLTRNGKHSISVRALDRMGNMNGDTVGFKVEPPAGRGVDAYMAVSLLSALLIIMAIGSALYLRRRNRRQAQ